MRDELSKVKMNKDDTVVLSNALSAIKNKTEDSGESVGERALVAALIAAAQKDYLSSINTGKGQWEKAKLLITVEQIVNKMSDLQWMQKAKNIKVDNNNNDNGEVRLTNGDKNFKETALRC